MEDWQINVGMKKACQFTVPGNPKAQGRPRFARAGKFVRTYDPKDSVDFKAKVALFARNSGFFKPLGPVSMEVKFYFKRPKNLCRRADSVDSVPCFKRPDVENCLKSLFDGGTGILFRDDAQIQSVTASKWYHEIGGVPRTEVTIY